MRRRQFLPLLATPLVSSMARAQQLNSGDVPPSPQEQQIEFDRELRKRVGERPIREGKVKVDVPVLADNGNSVACSIVVDSPMTDADHVKNLHLLLGRNPRPWAVTVHMRPGMPMARFDTRIRLAGTGRVLAVAEMNDGSLWSGYTDVQVTVSACVDGS